MRVAYRVIAALLAVEVAVQAGALAWGFFGSARYVADGGTIDKAGIEAGGLFPEELGLVVHGVNGTMVVPLLALLLLIVALFVQVRRSVALAAALVVAVLVQVGLGMMAHDTTLLGFLHGINALVIFGLALAATLRPGAPSGAGAEERPTTGVRQVQ